nr:ubiquitin carboxyl-terminal hydrolase 4-like isoform X3 [Procambarus clarkii]
MTASTNMISTDMAAPTKIKESTDMTASVNIAASTNLVASTNMSSRDMAASRDISASTGMAASTGMSASRDIVKSTGIIESTNMTASKDIVPSTKMTAPANTTPSTNMTASTNMTVSKDIEPSTNMTASKDIEPSTNMTASKDIVPSTNMTASKDIAPSTKMTAPANTTPSTNMTASKDIKEKKANNENDGIQNVEQEGNEETTNEKLYEAVSSGNIQTVKNLRGKNFDFNQEIKGEKLLHVAAKHGHVEVLTELLKGGADVDATSSNGDTALHITIRNKVSIEVVLALNDHEARWNIPDQRGWTALHLAVAMGNIDALKTYTNRDYSKLKLSVDTENATLLHYAAANGQKGASRWLVEHGLSRGVKDRHGYTPDQYASMAGDESLASFLNSNRNVTNSSSPAEMNTSSLESRMTVSDMGITKNYMQLKTPTTPKSSVVPLTETNGTVKTHYSNKRKAPSPPSPTTGDFPRKQKHKNATTTDTVNQGEENFGFEMQDDPESRTAPATIDEKQMSAERNSLTNEDNTKLEIKEALPVRGLVNLGNTCYMNSVLQCLYHTRPLTWHFINGEKPQKEVAHAYWTLLQALLHGNKTKPLLVNMKKIAGNEDAIFQDDSEKEAHDFLAQMLEWLHQDLAQVVDKNECDDEEDGPGLRSFISNSFHGHHSSEIVCNICGDVIVRTTEPFSNLTLPVTSQKICDIKDLLTHYYREQEIIWECKNCKMEHPCTQKSVIIGFPRFLLVHLSRVNDDTLSRQKVQVSYPLECLSLGDYTKSSDDRRITSPSYDLYAICCHQGSMTSGHYTAYCRSDKPSTDSWNFFSDTFVRKAKPKEVVSNPDAHILFYEDRDACDW